MMEDPYLSSFLDHVNYAANSILFSFEFFFGLSYFIGKQLYIFLFAISETIVQCFQEFISFIQIVGFELIELEKSILRFFVLIYYYFGKVIEAFQTGFEDLISSINSAGRSIGNLGETAINLFEDFLLLFWTVPLRLADAFAIVGDSLIDLATFLLKICDEALEVIILSPINAFGFMYRLLVRLLFSPFNFIASVPPTAYLGLVTLIMVYFFFCNFSILKGIAIMFRLIKRGFKYVWKLKIRKSKQEPSTATQFGGEGDKKGICVICLQKQVAFLGNPCNHLCVCDECIYTLINYDDRCPVCRKLVTMYSRVYIS